MSGGAWEKNEKAGRRVLVTGAAGLVGGRLVEVLQAKGFDVVATDLVANAAKAIIACDLTDKSNVASLTDAGQIHTIVHCGAISSPMAARDKPNLIVDANINGTANLLEFARRTRIGSFVYCSSTSVYGDAVGLPIIAEDYPLKPKTVYGASKVAGEFLFDGYARQFGLRGHILRIGTVYGPQRKNFCAIRALVEAAVQGTTAHLRYGRKYYRQYVHVDDVAHALSLALQTSGPGVETANITGGSYLTLEEIALVVRDRFPSFSFAIGSDPDPSEDNHHRISIERARRILKFEPRVSLDAGIDQLASHLRTGA